MAVYWPNEEDRRKIQQMWDDYKRRSPQPLRSGGEPTPMQPVGSALIAKAPEDGIPALETESSGTGTASNDEPRAGHAECEIYQLVNGDLVKTSVIPKEVYNIGETDIPGGTYVLIHQTKFGKWVAGQAASSDVKFVIPNQDVSAGELASPDNGFTVTRGPAWGSSDEILGSLEGDFAQQDFTTADYCIATNVNGKWYISCYLIGGAPVL